MYHPEIIERRLWAVQKEAQARLTRYSLEDSIVRQDSLEQLWDLKKKQYSRPFSTEESRFIANEVLMCKFDFRYWAERYSFINTKASERQRIKFWETQEIAMAHVAQGELDAWKTGGDNLWCWGKARQLGGTEICQRKLCHRLIFYPNIRAVIASDEPENATKLSRRTEFIYDNLPKWMQPNRKFHVKGTEMFFDRLNSALYVGHGRKEGSGIAQGDTTNIFHLTEIPDWQNWKQIDEDFYPTVPIHPTSTGFLESTAKIRDDHWHKMYMMAWNGKSRLKALFIPYYSDALTYRRQPPSDWKPAPITLQHAKKVELESPMYCKKTIHLSLEQMYWWEITYFEYKELGRLHVFFSEYPSTHLEAFTSPGGSVFPTDLTHQMRLACKPPQVFSIMSN